MGVMPRMVMQPAVLSQLAVLTLRVRTGTASAKKVPQDSPAFFTALVLQPAPVVVDVDAASNVAQTHSTDFFLAPKYLAPCQPLVTVTLPILLATLSATGPIILRPSGALLPTSEAFLEPILGAHTRCEVCTTPRDNHTMTPPPPKKNTFYVKKTPNSPPLQAPPPPPRPIYKVH